MSVSKAKGTRFESEVVEYLRSAGFPHVERRALRGIRDTGDLSGLPGWVIEVKNTKTLKLGEFVAEAEAEAKRDGGARWVLIHKRHRRGVDSAHVTMSLAQFAELLGVFDTPLMAKESK
jgi:Holliday junction resolvase